MYGLTALRELALEADYERQ